MKMVVRERREEAPGVVSLVMSRADGRALPPWGPGAHVDIVLPSGLIRQYSLSSSPADRFSCRIGVHDAPEGRGGSREVHELLLQGGVVEVSEPRNHFALAEAQNYVFVAGGIGITPILPMIAWVEAQGRSWRLVFGGRSHATMPFVSELEAYGDHVTLVPQDERGLIDFAEVLGAHDPARTLVYACGPEPMLDALERAMANWPNGSLRTERFRAGELDTSMEPHAFEVECVFSGVTLQIGPTQSILEAAQDAGLPVYASCEEGTCGTCLTTMVEGQVHHRDSLLTTEERSRQDCLTVCVSRAAPNCDKLVLEL